MKYLFLLFISHNSFAFYEMDEIILDNNFKVCIIGDTGTGSITHKMMAKELAKEGCGQVRILGDVIYPNGLSSIDDDQFYTKFVIPFQNIINSSMKPKFHIITGNHDYKGISDIWTKLDKKHKYIFSPKMYFAEKYPGNICFINLDTSPLNKLKYLRFAFNEFIWLKDLTNYKPKCSFTVGFGHHPFWSSGTHGDANFIQKWLLDYYVIGEMNAYYSGHDHHNGYEGTINNTDLYISGGFSKIRKLKRESRGKSFDELGYLVATFHTVAGKISMKTKVKVYRSGVMETVFEKFTN